MPLPSNASRRCPLWSFVKAADDQSAVIRHCSLPLLLLLLSFASVVSAAQQTFWPLPQYPPARWSLASTSAAPLSVTIPGLGNVLTRHYVITNLTSPVLLPTVGDVGYSATGVRMDFEVSADGGASWMPYSGNGTLSQTIDFFSEAGGTRLFGAEITSLSITANGALGAVLIRESPALTSDGQLTAAATNGGNFLACSVNLALEASVDGGVNWLPGSSAVAVALGGPAGTPAVLSLTRVNGTNALLCWTTQTNVQYQLQRKGSLGGATSWIGVGALQPGTVSNLCILEAMSVATNGFYRVQLSP